VPHIESEIPLLFTRPQLAKLFRKDSRTITKWLEDGLPCAMKGRGGRPSMFNLPDCVQWVVAREVQSATGMDSEAMSPAIEMAKLNRRRREELELKMLVRRGELVEAEAVRTEFAGLAVAVKARIRSVPDTIADQVVGQTPAAARALMLARLDDALRELARGEGVVIVLPPADEPIDADEPADGDMAEARHA